MSLKLSDFKIGDRVLFIREANSCMAADDPFYAPPIPAGKIATVIEIKENRLRIRLDDKEFYSKNITIWEDDYPPKPMTNTLSSLKKI
ncbi:MAG: hypothetical protein HYU63_04980 [Armatimonadetes bacterium]|nr:hypothetical protein [Armatimonadota bacterium]